MSLFFVRLPLINLGLRGPFVATIPMRERWYREEFAACQNMMVMVNDCDSCRQWPVWFQYGPIMNYKSRTHTHIRSGFVRVTKCLWLKEAIGGYLIKVLEAPEVCLIHLFPSMMIYNGSGCANATLISDSCKPNLVSVETGNSRCPALSDVGLRIQFNYRAPANIRIAAWLKLSDMLLHNPKSWKISRRGSAGLFQHVSTVYPRDSSHSSWEVSQRNNVICWGLPGVSPRLDFGQPNSDKSVSSKGFSNPNWASE
jgi:hypothetical protein